MTSPDSLFDRIAQLETDLQVARTNANHWKTRFESTQNKNPNASILAIDISSETYSGLHREATMRFIKPDQLAKRIIEIAVRDKLFAAVLDQ